MLEDVGFVSSQFRGDPQELDFASGLDEVRIALQVKAFGVFRDFLVNFTGDDVELAREILGVPRDEIIYFRNEFLVECFQPLGSESGKFESLFL